MAEMPNFSPTTTTNSPSLPPALIVLHRPDAGHLAPPPQQQPTATSSNQSPSQSSSSSITHHQSVPAATRRATLVGMPPSPLPLLRRRPSPTSLGLDTNFPPPPSAPLPAEQVERYWRLQRRLAATLLPEVVRLEALCAEVAAAAAAAGAGGSPSSSPPRSGSGSGSNLPPSPSPRAGQDPHAATRIAALRRRTLVPLIARLRALPVSETEGRETTTTVTTTSTTSSSSSSPSLPCSPSRSNTTSATATPVPTRADLAALRRAAAVLPRYLEQLRVATRGRPRAFDSERTCAAATA